MQPYEWTYRDRSYHGSEVKSGIWIIWECGSTSSGYDWNEISVLRRGEPGAYEYAAYIDGGCSCNYPYEGKPDAYDLSWNSNPQAIAGELRMAIENDYNMTTAEKATEKADLTMFLKNERYKNV